MSVDVLDPESRALVDSALQHARAIRAEIARLEARDFVLTLPHAVLEEIARRADVEIASIRALPDDPTFASPSVPTVERLDALATRVAALRHLHSLLSLLSRVHSSRLPFELVRPFEGLAAQLLQVDSTSLLLRPFEEYFFCIRPWAGPDGLLSMGRSEALENSFCVMCPSAEVGTFRLFAILAHELGHPLYQRRVLEGVTDDLGAAVGRARAELFPTPPGGEPTDIDLPGALGTLSKWTEEVFCDLVGTRLLGPAYASAFHSTLPVFWMPEGDENYPSSCLRMAAIEAGLTRWWSNVSSLRPVLDAYPLQRESLLSCPAPNDTALRIATHALTTTREGETSGAQAAHSLFDVLLSRIEEHVPTPGSWPDFASTVLRAAERIADLTPPDPYLLERERTFASHELVAFAFISSGLGRQAAFDRWQTCYDWRESKCNSALADLSLKGLEASDMQRRHRSR